MDNEYVYMYRDNNTGEHYGGTYDRHYFDFHSGKIYSKKPSFKAIKHHIKRQEIPGHVVIVKYKLVEVEQIEQPAK